MNIKSLRGVWEALDDGGAEEALDVAAAGELKARNEFFSDGSTADDVATLENGDGEARASQVSSGCEAVVAGADHQRVPFLLLQCARGVDVATETPSPHFFVIIAESPSFFWFGNFRQQATTVGGSHPLPGLKSMTQQSKSLLFSIIPSTSTFKIYTCIYIHSFLYRLYYFSGQL